MSIREVSWYFPPTKGKDGTAKYANDLKTVILVETDLFEGIPVIVMGDIHSHTPAVVRMLDELVHLDQFVVLSCGDMAGNIIVGADGDPSKEYEFLNKRAREFYFVQGNHDLPNDVQGTLINKQKQRSYISDGTVIKTLIGNIGGVNGIISSKSQTYKIPANIYLRNLRNVIDKNAKIIMTHDTPALPIMYQGTKIRYVGNEDIFNIINSKTSQGQIHFYGHCHHPTFFNSINGNLYINVDGRVIIFIGSSSIPPTSSSSTISSSTISSPNSSHSFPDSLFKGELEDLYSYN